MIYVPKLYNLEAEYKALDNQNFSNNVFPLLLFIMDQKKTNSPKSISDDFENLIRKKSNNNFFVSIPQNLPLTSKPLKPTVNRFYTAQKSVPNSYVDLMKRFSAYSNVIPTLEVQYSSYYSGLLTTLKSSIPSSSNSYAYYVKVSTFNLIKNEINNIITDQDYLIYDLDTKDFNKSSIKKEILDIQNIKQKKKFKTVVIKQIYSNLTFPKYPDGKILPGTDAYDCIDFDFYEDFKTFDFEGFGDCVGIRDIPIYRGGISYPSYLTVELDTFDHHGFKGLAKNPNSFESTLLPKYILSNHWNHILTPAHKLACNGCLMINNFYLKLDKSNSAQKWKTITISHFLESMDYKLLNGLI